MTLNETSLVCDSPTLATLVARRKRLATPTFALARPAGSLPFQGLSGVYYMNIEGIDKRLERCILYVLEDFLNIILSFCLL